MHSLEELRKKSKISVMKSFSSFFLSLGLVLPLFFSATSFSQAEAITTQEVLILLKSDSSTSILPRRNNFPEVLTFLKSRTQTAFEAFQKKLQSNSRLSSELVMHEYHWINHSLFATVTPKALRQISLWPEVEEIDVYRKLTPPESMVREVSAPSYPYSFKAMRLDRMIEEHPELTGKGVVLGSVDTGVDGMHPDLQGKIIRFLVGKTRKESAAVDTSGHGTATVGVMVGGSRQGPFYGVAPDAKMIATSAVEDLPTLLYALEWMLEAHPRAVNNSWSAPPGTPGSVFYKIIEAFDAAGILFISSAGNQGTKPRSITVPHEHPFSFSVGATDEKNDRWSYSSQGPATYQGHDVRKPEIMAPGDEIWCPLPYHRYGAESGTSFAAPQVTGAVALILQAAPELTPEQVRKLLILTAKQFSGTDQGQWSGEFGYGMLDIEAAVKQAFNIHQHLNASFSHFTDFLMKAPDDQTTQLILKSDLSPNWNPDL